MISFPFLSFSAFVDFHLLFYRYYYEFSVMNLPCKNRTSHVFLSNLQFNWYIVSCELPYSEFNQDDNYRNWASSLTSICRVCQL